MKPTQLQSDTNILDFQGEKALKNLNLLLLSELCQVQYLVPEVQGTSCTLYRLVGIRYFRVPCTCSQVQSTFEYLVPTHWYKVLLRTLYLLPGTRSSTGSGTNRYRVKYIFFIFFYLIMATLRRLILIPKGY